MRMPGLGPPRPPVPLLIALALLAAGCASTVPDAVRDPGPVAPLTVAEAQRRGDPILGQRARWGGSILSVDNGAGITEIEVLARPLTGDGAPRPEASPEGRFIARIQGFVDPAVYAADRRLTVVGRLVGIEERAVGDYPYRYPVIAVSARYLWPPEASAAPSGPRLYGTGWWGWAPYGRPGPYWSPYYAPYYAPGYGGW